MPNIQINIKNKVARADRAIIVCDNSDYTAVFDFDDEWSAYETKTARFVYCGTYTDAVFTGNSCPIPEMHDTRSLTVGVYAGDLHTTTPAYISCVPSILCGNGIPADPTPDVYNQIMELLNKESGVWYPAVDDAGNMSWTRSMSETEPQPVNIKGHKGDAGADGVDGKSAYELAQDNGFTGTMQEWLASLVGADGANGADGKDGISPAVSVAAITGGNRITITDAEGAKTFDVMDGAQGASGADGKDYVLTDTDKQEIAKTAAGLVDVPSVQPDWNQNDETAADYVKNRPFYSEKEIVDVSWDGDKTNKVSVADVYYKVSDLMPTADEFVVYLKTGETETSETINGSSVNINYTAFRLVNDYAIICYDASQLLMGQLSFPETGMYFVHLGDKYVSRLVSETEIVHTIDPKYIVHINELIMNSSTSDSTKKFKITVDDSGTITATEVS